MLTYPPISMECRKEDEVRIVPLKADTVMCETPGCELPARFLLKYKSGVLQAGCEKHANAITLGGTRTGICCDGKHRAGPYSPLR